MLSIEELFFLYYGNLFVNFLWYLGLIFDKRCIGIFSFFCRLDIFIDFCLKNYIIL